MGKGSIYEGLLRPDRERFEEAVLCGCTAKECADMFGMEYKALEKWCIDEYGAKLYDVMTVLKAEAMKRFKGVLHILAARGNNTAIGTLADCVYDMTEKEKVQKIQIVGEVPEE